MPNFIYKTIVLLQLFLWSACDKCPEFTGQILEFGTEKPIKNAVVNIFDCQSSPDLLTTTCDNKRTDSTDAKGYYWFEQNGAFMFTAEADGYWPTESGGLGLSGTKECSKPIDVHLYPHAWVRIKAINQMGIFEIFDTRSDAHSGQEIKFAVPQGDSVIVTNKLRANLNQKYLFGIQYSIDGTYLTSTDSLTCYVNNIQVMPQLGNALYLETLPLGHDTLDITIIY